ncbi:hypothetical protein [Cypionkella sp.]|jgi:hypothetical protein|uniref:hypothetical protein n=1 Tax=Cypionkella sp. TaxID=2811411 RepID=UPI002722BF3D|nr:hypothetical protein [Cypionkella sp.]MDO8982252.1 hypothetical protein [Cypionkella sp.]MDP2049845.1 hypothetical protein [Cypionkella sp.]
MTLPDLLLSQLSDPFRIGLLIALFITMLRTRTASGIWVPLAAGVVFVAVILPTTMQNTLAAPLSQVIGVGVLANVVIVALIMAAWEVYQRVRR